MNAARLQYLVDRYYNKIASAAEREELMVLFRDNNNDDELVKKLKHLWENDTPEKVFPENTGKAILKNIVGQSSAHEIDEAVKPRVISFMKKIMAAAAIVILIATGAYFFFNNKSGNKAVARKAQLKPLLKPGIPGGNKAVLQLADGTEIFLDKAANGTLAQQGTTKILKLNGLLSYNANSNQTEILYNIIATPRGGQYQLILADGTKVWLNAASSLRFPTAFAAKERTVELSGEGYFEVAKNNNMPFIVAVNNMQVRVLGTHFNIMAYGDEAAFATTLLEGSVQVTSGSAIRFLKPGQQAQLNKTGELKLISDVDVEESTGWKNGMFHFNKASTEVVMRQLSRWYDVEVIYEGKVPKKEFVGKVSRSANASEVLKILEVSGVRFKNEGNKITVMP